jgi:hypothetical protein
MVFSRHPTGPHLLVDLAQFGGQVTGVGEGDVEADHCARPSVQHTFVAAPTRSSDTVGEASA